MKCLTTTFLVLLTVLFFASSTSYSQNKPYTILDGILQIPFAAETPTIDGELDGVWLTVTGTPMVLSEGASLDTVISFDDHYSNFRVMWDDDNFYVFLSVVDDTLKLDINTASPWLNDCVEIFFDGGNEKASAYDTNDVQWRWVYPETVENHPATGTSPGTWMWKQTSSGYNFELAISRDSLASRFDLESDKEIGFEISGGDLETSTSPQTVLHWWTNDGTTWNNPSLFGTALLSAKEVTSILTIPYAFDTPAIDGIMEDDEGWQLTDEISFTKFEGAPDGDLQDSTFHSWRDHTASYWTLWDEDYFYLFAKVIDDSLKLVIDVASPWNNDCVEIFFDGGNEKASAYDTNDVQWRWVYPETVENHPATGTSPGEWIWTDTELGYDFELRISADSLASRFTLENDKEIGFEVSNGDLETAASPQLVLHWWTNVATTWNNPSLFGTALLTTGSVDVEEYTPVATNYSLEQNYPNPFNPSTRIIYSVMKSDKVKLTVYNLLGNEIEVLVNENQAPGTYTIRFDSGNLASGVYFYKLEAGDQLLVKKMMLLK